MTFELRTARCALRPIEPGDTTELHALWTTPGVRRFLWDDIVIPLEQAAEVVSASRGLFEQHRFGLWAVRLNTAPEIVGFAGIWPFRGEQEFELLFGVAEPLWGRGYAVETSQAVLDHCYTALNMPVVRASIDAPNAASARVLDKLGFARVRRDTVDGLDLVFYERSRT